MTTETATQPFITGFASRLDSRPAAVLRYDDRRQVSQVLIGGVWLDASLVSVPSALGTRLTKVAQETTDDE